MIDFTVIRWEFENSLYSIEVVETSFVDETIEKLRELIEDYKTETAWALSDIFWKTTKSNLDFKKIKAFLEESKVSGKITDDSELVACQKILGPDLKHGHGILKQIYEIAQSLIDGGGLYDHTMVIEEFLKNPGSNLSSVEKRAIKEALKALRATKNEDPNFGSPRKVRDLLEYLGIENPDSIKYPEILDFPLKIYIDDGMGYGATNGDVLDIESRDSEVRLWM